MGILLTSLLSSCLCVCLLILIKFIYQVWWTPIRLQRALGKQGIRGPPYNYFHGGNSTEIVKMRQEAISKPMNISSHYMFPRIHPYLYSWVKQYGPNVLHWIGPQAFLYISETEMIKEILNKTEAGYPKLEAEEFEKKLLGEGLATSRGEKWAKARKLANHEFHGDSLKNMIPDMITSVEIMVKRWEKYVGKEIEVFEELRLLTSEVISKTAFGSSFLQGEKIFEMLIELTEIFSRNEYKYRFPIISKLIRSEDDIESEKLENEIKDSVTEMIRSRERKVASGESENFGNDFLGQLVKASHDVDVRKRFSVDDMIDECKTFFVAGQETTNSLLSWAMLLLAIHPEWQEEARKEVFKLFGQGAPTSDGISKLKILHMIINESLRLYPPVVGVTRKVEREVRIGKFTLPADLNFYISTLASHHDARIWGEDVHLFNPERFAEGVAKATRNNIGAFFPFSLGPRTCVGNNFAMIESKITLSMILQRYSFTLSPSYVHAPIHVLTLKPQQGVQLMLHAL